MTTANKITVVRILMIPIFVTLAIYYGQSIQEGDPQDWQRFAAITVFLLAAVSDGLDGYVARRYNQRSSLGMILDPIADKGLAAQRHHYAQHQQLEHGRFRTTENFPPGFPCSSSRATRSFWSAAPCSIF